VFFSKICREIQVSLKSDKNDGYFTWRRTYIYDIWLSSSENEKLFRQILEKKSTHKFHVQKSFFSEILAGGEIMWKKILQKPISHKWQ